MAAPETASPVLTVDSNPNESTSAEIRRLTARSNLSVAVRSGSRSVGFRPSVVRWTAPIDRVEDEHGDREVGPVFDEVVNGHRYESERGAESDDRPHGEESENDRDQ